MHENRLNKEVTAFLDELNHPFRKEIEELRFCIIEANKNLEENTKWNGPNYCYNNEDRITMRIQPLTLKKIQLIFHRGAKVNEAPKMKLIDDQFDFLIWKTNDRAIATFTHLEEIDRCKIELKRLINLWLRATEK